MANESIFQKIIAKEIPADILYENQDVLCFKDIHPAAPWHYLMIPKREIAEFGRASVDEQPVLADLLQQSYALLMSDKTPQGDKRMVINSGVSAMQTVFHVHVHLLAGRPFSLACSKDENTTERMSTDRYTLYEPTKPHAQKHVQVQVPALQNNHLGAQMMALVQAIMAASTYVEAPEFRVVIDPTSSKAHGIGAHVLSGPELGWPPC